MGWQKCVCHVIGITHLFVLVEEMRSCAHDIYIYIATSGLGLNTWQELYLIFISFGSLAVRFKYLRKPITYHNLAVSIMSSGHWR